jgi:hypothetical protein
MGALTPKVGSMLLLRWADVRKVNTDVSGGFRQTVVCSPHSTSHIHTVADDFFNLAHIFVLTLLTSFYHLSLAAVMIISSDKNEVIRKIVVPKTDAIRSNLGYCIMRIGCDVICELDQDINLKIKTFQAICATVCRILKGRTR